MLGHTDAVVETSVISNNYSNGRRIAPAPTPHQANEGELKPTGQRRSRAIDKSMLAMPELRRVRDRDHVRSVAQHPCLICGRRPADVHHLRFTQRRALSRKVSNEFTVPLCRGHHREVYRVRPVSSLRT